METYKLLGGAPNAPLELGFAAFLGIIAFSAWKVRRPYGIVLAIGMMAVTNLVFAVIPVPTEWTAGFPVLWTGLFGMLGDKRYGSVVQWSFRLFAVAFVIGTFFWFPARKNDIVLRDDRMDYSYSGRNESLPRNGIQVSYMTSGKHSTKDWFAAAPNRMPGASVWGTDRYWGPRSFVNGDEVGQRIASWAGVQAKAEINPN